MNLKELIKEHIKDRLKDLEELGQVYGEEKIEKLADNLSKSGKSLTEISTLIDNKFSYQLRKIKHDNYLASLKEYYISSVDKLKSGNNCYLLSYEQGVKVLEQAYLKEGKKQKNGTILVEINKEKKGYKKENSINNDYELIMSDIAYLLNIDYESTYRIFDGKMEPQGILNISSVTKTERFLNLEESLRYVKEESPKFNLRQELLSYHDKHIKYGLKRAKEEEYLENIEYVFKLFSALPDITAENIDELKYHYLNMKVFELLTNSLDNNLNNIGLMVNKKSLKKYTYRLSPSYNKYTTKMDNLEEDETICNFFIVKKKALLATLINNYYDYIKDTLSLIADNSDTLVPIINQVIKEHLEYGEYDRYSKLVKDNVEMIKTATVAKKELTPDSKDDQKRLEDNNTIYQNKIAPLQDNYVSDEYEGKGSTLLTALVTAVLFITIGIILLAIFAVSRMNM